jgi:CRP/FNR family cyclic AMP-dependent transcriptional regulator
MRGDQFEYWTGVVSGLARMGIVLRGGKAAGFAGLADTGGSRLTG